MLWVALRVTPVMAEPVVSSAPAATPAASPRSLVEQIKRSVVFLSAFCAKVDEAGSAVLDTHGEPVIASRFDGTGFLLSVSDPRLVGRAVTYLVTNRHLAQPGIEHQKPCTVAYVDIHLDRKMPDRAGSYTEAAWASPVFPDTVLSFIPKHAHTLPG